MILFDFIHVFYLSVCKMFDVKTCNDSLKQIALEKLISFVKFSRLLDSLSIKNMQIRKPQQEGLFLMKQEQIFNLSPQII